MSFINALLSVSQGQSKPRGGVNYDKPIGPPAPKRESYDDQLKRLQNAGKSRTREDEQLDAILKGDFTKAKQIRDNDRAKKRAARGDVKTVAQKKTETPGTWNNSVAQARKRLGIKQGEDLDSLLKSALWVYRYSDADETTSKAEIDDVVRMMQSPEGRNELKARIERFRNPQKPEQQVKAGNLSESELEAKRREFEFQDSMDASGLGKTFRTIEDSQKKIESNPFLAKLAQVTGAVAETATLPGIALNAAGVDVAGITEDVTKSAVSGTLTTPARIPANLMKLVSGGVPIEQRGYALAELVADALDVGGLTGMALKANKAGIKEVVKALAEEAVKAGNVAEDVVEQAVKAIDDIPEEQIDEITYSFRQPENVGGDVGAEFRPNNSKSVISEPQPLTAKQVSEIDPDDLRLDPFADEFDEQFAARVARSLGSDDPDAANTLVRQFNDDLASNQSFDSGFFKDVYERVSRPDTRSDWMLWQQSKKTGRWVPFKAQRISVYEYHLEPDTYDEILGAIDELREYAGRAYKSDNYLFTPWDQGADYAGKNYLPRNVKGGIDLPQGAMRADEMLDREFNATDVGRTNNNQVVYVPAKAVKNYLLDARQSLKSDAGQDALAKVAEKYGLSLDEANEAIDAATKAAVDADANPSVGIRGEKVSESIQQAKQVDDLPPVTDTAADVPKTVPQKAVDEPEGFQYRQRDTNELREKYGLQPNAKQKRGDAESLRLVEERNLVSQARDIATDKSKKVLDVEEQFALAIRAEQIDDELSTLLRKMESGDFEYAGESIERLTSELESITTALHKKGGSEAARTLGARSRILQRLQDNPLAYTTAVKRAPLTADEASKVSKIEKELADARAEIQRLQREGVNKRLGTVRQPRKIEVAIAKTDEQLAAWRKRMESATMQGGKRGGAALPADLVIEGIYLVSKSAVLKGIKSLDDIVRAVRAEGIEADDKQIAEVVGDVLDDLKTPRKKASGPTRATLRKEIKALLEEKPSDYIETMLREAEGLLKSETPESFEQADELLRQSRSLRARVQSGRSYGDDTLIRGKAGIEDERLVRARGKEILARKKIEALARELKRKHEFESGTIGKKMAMGATQVANNARQMLTIGDNSVVGRQGIVALVTNPKAWGKAFVRSSGSFVSPEKYATRIKELMFGDEMYDDAIAHGLDLTVGPGALEEDLVTVFANAPIIKNSNEAYEVGANTMRLGMYKSLTKYDGLTSREKDAIANFVNIATGRTTTSLGTGKAADLINGAAFAPRYALSRLQFLMGQPIWQAAKTSPKAAAIIAAEYAKFYSAAGALFYGLKKGEEQGWWTVDTNPNSSNFGKVNIGKTSIDVTGGFRAYATLLSRGVSQIVRFLGGSEALKDFPSVDSNGRKTTDFANQFFWSLRSRLSPFARIIDTALSNKDGELKSFGRKTDPIDMAIQSATPIGAQQAAQGYVNDLETKQILWNLGLEFFGIGIDVEDEKNKKKSLTESVIEKAFVESR